MSLARQPALGPGREAGAGGWGSPPYCGGGGLGLLVWLRRSKPEESPCAPEDEEPPSCIEGALTWRPRAAPSSVQARDRACGGCRSQLARMDRCAAPRGEAAASSETWSGGACKQFSNSAMVWCSTSSSCRRRASARRSRCSSLPLSRWDPEAPMPNDASCSDNACATAAHVSGGPAAMTCRCTAGTRGRMRGECKISFSVGRCLGFLLNMDLIRFLVPLLQLAVMGV
mmetsp:Transcript_34642/g.99861  ORF Transcript_34642/g.99861 Transcript_34642/m.99861 type:complete len:228 (-) Transcript_34642:732-1415(-)